MKNRILKRIKAAKIYRICLIVLAALCFPSVCFLGSHKTIFIFYFLSFALIIGGYVYLVSFHPIIKSAKWFESVQNEHIIDDIPITSTLPNSKIHCGSQVLFSNKPFSFIPYSEMAWIYMSENKAYGITVAKQIHIFCKNGKHFILRANIDEFQWLLENYLMSINTDIIIGYGFKQKRQYKNIKAMFRSEQNMKRG